MGRKGKIVLGHRDHKPDMDVPGYRAAYENRRFIYEVAIAVKKMRERTGMTQTELADLIGSTQSVVSRLERGTDQRIPRIDLMRRIGAALRMPLTIVFGAQRKDRETVLVHWGKRAA